MADIVFRRILRTALLQHRNHRLLKRLRIHARFQHIILMIDVTEKMATAGVDLHLFRQLGRQFNAPRPIVTP